MDPIAPPIAPDVLPPAAPELAGAVALEQEARRTAEARAQAAERELASANDRLDRVADERASELIELTERLMHEVNVRERTERRMAARYAAERAVTEGNAPLDMARRVINELCRRLGWEAGSFWWRDESALVCVDGLAVAEADAPRFWKLTGMRLEDPRTFPVSVLDGGQPEWRVGRTGHATLDAVHTGFAGWCAFPIVVDGATSGVLLITSRAPQLPDEDLLGDLAAVGRAFGRAVERRAAVERLRITTSRLTTLISNLSGAVLLEDEARRIVLVNQPFCDTFGIPVPPESLVGSDCSSSAEQSKALFADPEGFVAGIDAILAAREPELGKLLHLADGRVLERDFLPVVEADRYLGHLWLYRDVTDRIRYEGELRDARERAEAGTRAKSAFIATMSHEIRTPLNAVINMTELLLETPLTTEQQRLVNAAVSAGRALNEIVDDVLDFSKIEAGRMTVERVGMDPVELLRGVHTAYAPLAAHRGLGLDLVVGEDLPPLVAGDPARIRQVVANLVSNALKFTHQGGVAIGLDRAGENLRFRVEDTGIGIAPEVQARLFQPFTQADSSTTRLYGGTGLGLAICRELVERMGGAMQLESVVDRGSVFSFTLPLEIAAGRHAESPPHRDRRVTRTVAQEAARVLIAEDTELNREVLATLLARFPVQVEMAPNGAAALDRLSSTRFDLVLMDCQMPLMDGLEATRRFRAIETEDSRTPIVALTADVRNEAREATAAAGMDDYLAKPIDREALAKVLERWLDIHPIGHARTGASGAGGSAVRARVAPVLDVDTFRTLLAAMGGSERFLRVLHENVDRLAGRIAAVEALEPADRSAEYGSLAHALAGVAGQVGGRELEAAARALETASDPTAPDMDAAAALAAEIAMAVTRMRTALDEELANRPAA